jgi:UDP-N-acetylmuramate dehydrogenase
MHDYQLLLERIGFKAAEMRVYAPLKELTWFKVGGNADLLLISNRRHLLPDLFRHCYQHSIPLTVLGDGSNVVISDEGIEGIVLHTTKCLALSTELIPTPNHQIHVPAGVLMEDLILTLAQLGLGGLEVLYGLPGTLGGALFMNAQCYNRCLADVFVQAEVLMPNGLVQIITKNDGGWGYKRSPFQHTGALILSAWLQMQPDNPLTLQATAYAHKKDRNNKGHFRYPCAGSIFKNDRTIGKPSGQILESCGLKEFTIGGAQISSFHANIIINQGNALASDIFALTCYAQSVVQEQQGHLLEPEIIFLGRNFS